MSDLPNRYRYRYSLRLEFGHWKHSYELVGRHGGLHFHVIDFGPNNPHVDKRYSAGLECHWRTPPAYMAKHPPSHDECWLLKQPCWHDGTSLYAEETIMPRFNGRDHELMFRFLAREADERFTEESRP